MKLNTYTKIANQLYTYLKQSGLPQEQNTQDKISFQEIKKNILGKNDDLASNLIKSLSTKNQLTNLINKKDNQGYTLLILAASNNMIKTVKQLIIAGADTTSTIKIKGQRLRTLLNVKLSNGSIDEDEYNNLLQQKYYDAMAIDIAEMKKYNQIVKILS